LACSHQPFSNFNAAYRFLDRSTLLVLRISEVFFQGFSRKISPIIINVLPNVVPFTKSTSPYFLCPDKVRVCATHNGMEEKITSSSVLKFRYIYTFSIYVF